METPGPSPGFTLDETLEVFDDPAHRCTPLTASDVADALGGTRDAASRTLEDLTERDELETKRVGEGGRVWWRPGGTEDGGEGDDGPRRVTSDQFVEFVRAVEDYAIFVLDPEGHVSSWNEGAERIKGYDEEEIIGEHFSTFYTDEDVDRGVPAANLAAAEEEGRTTDEGWRVHRDGSRFWARVTITAIRNDDGTLEGFTKVTRDLTERKRAEDERRLRNAVDSSITRAASLADGLESAVVNVCSLTDWEYGEALLADDGGLERSTAYADADAFAPAAEGSTTAVVDPGEGIVGRSVRSGDPELVSDLSAIDDGVHRQDGTPDREGDDPGATLCVPVTVGGENGAREEGEVQAVLLFATSRTGGVDDRFVEAVESVAADLGSLAERVRAEAALAREREFLETTLQASPVGIGVFSADGGLVRSNPRAAEILGISEERVGAYAAEDRTVFDEDGDPVPPADRPFARVFETGEPVTDWECGIERPDGERRWLSVSVAPILDDDEVEQVVATGEDITDLKDRERQLRRERDFVERVLETVPTSVLVVDRDGGIERTNERARARLGLDGSAAGSIDDLAVYDADGDPVPPGDRPDVRTFETGEPVTGWEGQVDLPTGRAWLSVNAVPLGDGESPERVLVAANDVTKLKEQAERLERQRDDLETELGEVFDRVTDAFFALDDEWRFTHVNERAEELVERSEAEMLGENIWAEFPAAVDGVIWEQYHRAMETQEPVSFETSFEPLDLWAEVNAYPSETGLSVYFQDVSDRVERERELERYETIVNTVQDGVYTVDADGRFTMVNDAYAEMTGYPREDLLGAPVTTVVDERTRERARDLDRELVAGERETAKVEADVLTADGGTVRAEATFALLPGDDDYERVSVVRDVTERVERERELEEYERIVETVDDGVYVLDAAGRFTMVNTAFVSMTRFDREDLLGSHASTVFGETFRDLDREARLQFETGEVDVAVFEEELHTADDETITVESRFQQFAVDDGRGRVGVVRDITDRKAYERELETRARQQGAVADLGHDALDAEDLDALFARASRLVADVLDTDYCKVLELDAGGEELLLRQGAGWPEGVVGEATVAAHEDDSQAAYTLDAAEPVVVEDLDRERRFAGPDLLTDHGVRSGVSTVLGPPDDPWGVLGTHDTDTREFSEHDVTFVQSVANVLATAIERQTYRNDLEELVEELEESNERLEQFAYIASHDLQEPLRMVSNYLQLVESRYADDLDEDGREFIDFAVDGAERMREMVNDLLAYSRIDTEAEPPESTDCEEVVEGALRNLEVQIDEHDVEVEVDPLPTVTADRSHLEQVFQNLISNAVKYRDDDPPRIEVGATERDDEWVFHVADNGIGIPPERQDRIFEVFRRLHTREEYPGTGIGLALCRKIVERHDGRIWVESEPDEGSTFYFTLPRTPADRPREDRS